MNFSHRNRGRKEARDVWVRSFPLQSLNRLILSSLSKSEAGSKLQSITVARFILREITQLQNFNEECAQKGVPEFVDAEEVNGYLEMFGQLFLRIVSDNEWTCESKTELIELVSRHHEEGTICFVGTRIPDMLLKAISPDRLQDTLLEAMLHPEETSKFNSLIEISSPGSPENFQKIFTSLLDVFIQSHYHSEVMRFTREFISKLEDRYENKFLLLWPSYFQPIIVIYQECRPFFRDSSVITKKVLYTVLLHSLENVYNPVNIQIGNLSETAISFYIAAACPKFLPILEEAFKLGGVTLKEYPYLWMHLHSVKKRKKGNLNMKNMIRS